MRYTEESARGPAITGPAPDHTLIAKDDPDMAKPQRTTSPAFQLYTAEFLSGDKVSRMSYMEVGIFTVLLCHAWTGLGLPNNVTEIAKKLKLQPNRFARIWAGVLHECWVERGGRLVNPRQEIERKKQAEYRKTQKEKAEKRWHQPGNATAMPEHMPRQSHGNAHAGNASLLQSSSSSSKERTQREGGAPIHTSHKTHVACGRVCVPADLHSTFARALNTDDADQVLRDWYTAVDNEWSVGARKQENPGGNDYRFWRARFEEHWPATVNAKPDPRLPKWAQKAKAHS